MTTDKTQAWLEGWNETIFPDVPLGQCGDGTFVGAFRQRVLSSAFQPIVSTVDGATVAHSARTRSELDGREEPPADVFALAGSDPLVVQFDRSARTLHVLNYHTGTRAMGRLFLRVQSRLVESVGSGHGRVFEGILGRLGVLTKDVVIQLPRHANEDPALYARALLSYRSLGYRVATECLDLLDPLLDGGYEVMPDIMVVDPRSHPDPETLPRLIGRIRDRGTTALVHRIETAAQLSAAIAAGTDLLQGYFLGRPARRPEAPVLDPSLLVRSVDRSESLS